MTYDNIKNPQNQLFTLSLEDTFFKKPQRGRGGVVKLTPPAVLGLTFKQLKTKELVVFKKAVFFTMYFSFISFIYSLVSQNIVYLYCLFV